MTRGQILLQKDPSVSSSQLRTLFSYYEEIDGIKGLKAKMEYATKHNLSSGKNARQHTYMCNSLVITVFTVYTQNRVKEVLIMATKALNFKMDEADILDMKHVASVFNMSVTDLIKNAVREYLAELKSDPFYRLTVNVQDASDEESTEILAEIEGLSDDDLTIASTKNFTV